MADITSNLLHWWKADEGTGTSATDNGSTAKTGTLSGSATWVGSGRIGNNALRIPGYVTSDYGRMQTAANTGIHGLSAMTFACWFKQQHVGDYVSGVLCSALWEGNYNNRFEILTSQSGTPRDVHIAICNGAASWIWAVNALPNDTNWHHLCVVYDGSQSTDNTKVKLYVDGVAITLGTWNASVPSTLSSGTAYGWQFGRRVDNTGPAKCDLDDIRVYTRALAPADVALLVQYTGAASQWEHVVSVKAGSTNGVSVTSSNVDTRTADVGFAIQGSVASFGQQPLYDNLGNYWKPIFSQSHSGGVLLTAYTCENLRTSATHNLFTGAIGNSPAIAATFYKGHKTVGMVDLSDYLNTGNAATFSPPTGITPSVNDALVLSIMASFAGSTAPIVDSNLFYQSYSCNAVGNNMGIGLGRIVQATATLVKPAWTTGSTGDHVTAVLSFKPRVAGDDITINEVEDGKIYQRATTPNNKLITVSGKYYNTAPTSVEVKLTDWTSGAIVKDWTPVSSLSASGGDWSGAIIPPDGGWYKRQVRMKNSGGTVLASGNTTEGKLGVGILIGCTGQSNMVRMFDTYGTTSPNSKTRQFGVSGLNWFPMTGDGACVLSDLIQSATGLPVGLLKYGVSGCGLVYDAGNGEWQSTGANKARTLFLDGITAAGGDIEAVLFFGTEADTFNASASSSGIQAGYESLYSAVRTLTGRSQSTQRFGASILGPITSGTAQRTLDIRQGTINFAANSSGGFIAADARDVPIAAGDSPHYTGPGYIMMGQQAALNYLREIGVASNITYILYPVLQSPVKSVLQDIPYIYRNIFYRRTL